MICLRIHANGVQRCVAGVGGSGLLILTIAGRQRFGLRLGGLTNEQHVRWLGWSFDEFGIGDEISISVVDSDTDPPAEKHPRSSFLSTLLARLNGAVGALLGAAIACVVGVLVHEIPWRSVAYVAAGALTVPALLAVRTPQL
jgi:hypothetical protein